MGWKAFGAKLENWEDCLRGLQGLGMAGDILGRLSSRESFLRCYARLHILYSYRPATLLLDTGANNTIINAKMYGNVQAPRIEAVSGPGIVGNVLRLRVDLEIGGRFLFSQPVSVMNLDDLPKRLGVQFDGLLGQDILRQFPYIRINYRSPVVELEK
jgi:Aspartyl protease